MNPLNTKYWRQRNRYVTHEVCIDEAVNVAQNNSDVQPAAGGTHRSRTVTQSACLLLRSINQVYYAALLPMRGPHIASHSVRPSVCPSVRPSVRPVSGCTLFTVAPSYERTSKIEKTSVFAYGPVRYVLFGTRRGPHSVRPSRPHKFLLFQ